MFLPNVTGAGAPRAPILTLLLPLALAYLVSGCAAMLGDDSPQIVSTLHRPDLGFVRIEHAEAGASDNAHPYRIAAASLREILARLTVKGAVFIDAVPVFDADDLAALVPHLSAGLERAGPREEVTFAITGVHGRFGKYSPRTVTTGRVFVQAEQLHVIFGLVHETYDSGAFGPTVTRGFTAGSRGRQLERGLVIAGDGWQAAEKRFDWLNTDAKVSPPPAAAPPSAPKTDADAADSRYRAIEEKLSVLDKLKANGLISDDEYRERRRAILEGL